jgi:TolB-like protein/Flp pilus assembly protein TadD
VSEKPGDKSGRISLWEDLKQRNVYRIGVGYAAVAWFTIEVSETILPRLGAPDWSVTLVIVLALAGYPVALFLSWLLQITPDGVVVDRPRRRLNWRAYLIIDLVIVAVLVSAASIYWFRIYKVEYAPDSPSNSIAVLPFVNIGDDPDNSAFSVGLADELLTLLARIEELKVASRTSSEYFRGRNVEFSEIADALGVRYLVEGSVQKEADRLRVTVQLIEAAANDHLWAENYEASLAGLLDLRARMAGDIIEGLKMALPMESIETLNERPTEDAQAYVWYLQGLEYLRRPRVESNLAEAERLFSEALSKDARFAGAHAGLCRTYLGRFEMQNDPEWFERAERACHRAITLDEQQVGVYIALGELYRLSSQFDESLEYFDLALRFDPDAIDALMNRGITLDRAGRFGEAEGELQRTVEKEPFYWRGSNSLGRFYMGHGRYSEAIGPFQRATELTPDNVTAWNNLAAALYMDGRVSEAISAFERSADIKPSRSVLMNLANLHYYQGEFRSAGERYRQAFGLAPKDDRTVGGLAASLRFVEGQSAAVREGFLLASELVEDLLEVTPSDSLAWARLASYRANLGDEAGAMEALRKAAPEQSADPEVWFFACLTYMPLDRYEEALDLVEKLIESGYPTDILNSDPDLEPIREDARYLALLSTTK